MSSPVSVESTRAVCECVLAYALEDIPAHASPCENRGPRAHAEGLAGGPPWDAEQRKSREEADTVGRTGLSGVTGRTLGLSTGDAIPGFPAWRAAL